jgi:hypothetical protein
MVNNFMDWALALWNKTVRQTEAEANEFLGNVGYILIEMMLRFKNPGFAQEDEWRVLLITWAQENQNLVRHRNRSGGQVPYIDWAFRPEYMDEVLIGPGPYGMNEEMPHEILAGCGMAHVPITHSTIPLR